MSTNLASSIWRLLPPSPLRLAALAQQSLTGTITKPDERNGKVTIQQTQNGTVGANAGGAAGDFKVRTTSCSTR
jgi:hypothetical protein